MTVNVPYEPLPYACNGATVQFPITWPFLPDAVIRVKLVAADGTETPLTGNGADYVLTRNADGQGGMVTTNVAPASGNTLFIERTTPRMQPDTLRLGGTFDPRTIEQMIDRAVLIDQEQERPVAGSPGAPIVVGPDGKTLAVGNAALTGDMLLRGHLASQETGKGTDLAAFPDPVAPAYLKTQSDINNGLPVSLHRFIDRTKLSGIRAMSTTHDCTAGFVEAFGAARSIYVPRGLHLYSGNLTILNDAQFRLHGEGSGHSILRAMGAGGIVYTNSNNHNWGMPRLDLKGLRLEAGVANAGNAITLTGTGGSGFAGVGSLFEDIEIVPQQAGFYWNKGVRGTNTRNARFSRVVVASNALTGQTTHGFHFDGNADPVELWFDGFCYLYYLTTGILVEGTYEGIYLHGINMTTVQDGLQYRPTGLQPVCHVHDSYINCRRAAVDLRDVSYFTIANNGLSSTGFGTGNFYAALIDRSGGSINASSVFGNSVVGGNGYTGGATENGVKVISGNSIDVHHNNFYTLSKGVEFVAGAGLREHDNQFPACTTPVVKPAAVSTTQQIPEALLLADCNSTGMTVTADPTSPVSTVLTYPRKTIDYHGYYDTATSRWTPPNGFYRIKAAAYFTTGILVGDSVQLSIRKNGVITRTAEVIASKAGQCCVEVDSLQQASGTDYFDIVATITGTAGPRTRVGANSVNYWDAHVIG